MKNNSFPITPPQWQVDDWCKQALAMGADVDAVFLEAARWGADQELEACCEEMKSIPSPLGIPFGEMASNALRAARRPKPPSLKEQALQALAELAAECYGNTDQSDTIRRALEKLDD